ncbi:hypothetical membrane protein [Thermoplasma acidophilum]|uniref:Hypothetical membrane protein n=1 Tax=Thermoplasma acidophilum (strain ATCC 25905 / DSM 1728 / JCM 9062 / NBRC 15155 / AMRC-C165) TaxID=273075 RepID=Q9HLF7_THEAC|nr:hypothetical protein [Thermoplasma acidophilum]CAC11416.1 hypothetical membrane protein [Thermoplasma acidophilum]
MAKNHPILKLSSIPLTILVFLLILSLVFNIQGNKDAFDAMPLIIFIYGISVIFYGAWSSFGSKKYVAEVMKAGMPLKNEDIIYINKKQLLLTGIFIGIGSLCMLVGYILNFFI